MIDAPSARAKETLTAASLEADLAGLIEPVPVTLGYRAGLLLVTVATLLLPLAYLGMVALAAWGVYLHALGHLWLVTRSFRWELLLLYITPILAGAVVVFFMFKPLLARTGRSPQPIEISPEDHPLLFALVDGISCAVGAPTPTRIAVDCEINASASLQPGSGGLLRRDLQLTIGLPLITGLTLAQLAGVLAHEMGHFAQGSAMRLTFLIRTTNAWLARVVYQRDEWDAQLEYWSKKADIRLGVVLWVARLAVWLSRKLLWVLMTVGHAIGTLMMRQM
ncbi:MAG TPA: M48 family metallopeptidase, partial [Myxococcaceae bacterium]|nr:M48 family metallopeptidase [Myxococcaceae bacterium]